jgi:hypothetical protein
MNAPSIRAIGIFTVLASLSVSGCKDDPPPPPPLPTATPGTATKPTDAVGAQVQRMSPEATKLFRVDMCFFGSQGLRHLAEAYTASLGGKEPSATNVPEFGDYPEPSATPRRGGRAEPTGDDATKGDDAKAEKGTEAKPAVPGGAVRQVPFLKYLRYCAVAKQLKEPAHEELDTALTAFDQYAGPLNRSLVEATRYFGTKQFERDEFKRGKALHEKLSEGLPKAGEELDKLQKGVEGFAGTLKGLPDELDEGGKIAQRAYEEARAAALLFLAPEVDAESAKAAIEKLKKSHEDLVAEGEKSAEAPHPKVVAPKIEALVSAIETALEAGATASSAERYPVFMAMADLVESSQRALAQLLNRKGGHPSMSPPSRMMKPRLRPGQVPPRMRPEAPPEGAQPE